MTRFFLESVKYAMVFLGLVWFGIVQYVLFFGGGPEWMDPLGDLMW